MNVGQLSGNGASWVSFFAISVPGTFMGLILISGGRYYWKQWTSKWYGFSFSDQYDNHLPQTRESEPSKPRIITMEETSAFRESPASPNGIV